MNKSPEILFDALFVILSVCVQLKLSDSLKRNNDYFYLGGNSLWCPFPDISLRVEDAATKTDQQENFTHPPNIRFIPAAFNLKTLHDIYRKAEQKHMRKMWSSDELGIVLFKHMRKRGGLRCAKRAPKEREYINLTLCNMAPIHPFLHHLSFSLLVFRWENKRDQHSVVAATAATLVMQRAGSMGNPDWQQSGSRVRAEGKGMACIQRARIGSSWGSQTDKNRKGGNSQRNGQTGSPLFIPSWFLASRQLLHQ